MLSFKARSSHSRISRSSSAATGTAGCGFFCPSAGRRCVGLRQLGIAREYGCERLPCSRNRVRPCGARSADQSRRRPRRYWCTSLQCRHHRFPRFRLMARLPSRLKMHLQKKGPALGIDLELVVYSSEHLANREFIPTLASQMVTDPILVLLFQDGLRISLLSLQLSPQAPLLDVGGARTISRHWQKHLVMIGTENAQDIRAPAAAFATSSRPPGR